MQYLHTMVRVADLDASLNFYCNLLGLEEVRRMDNEKGRFTLVFLAAPDDRERALADKAPMVELTYNWDRKRTMAAAISDTWPIGSTTSTRCATDSRPAA